MFLALAATYDEVRALRVRGWAVPSFQVSLRSWRRFVPRSSFTLNFPPLTPSLPCFVGYIQSCPFGLQILSADTQDEEEEPRTSSSVGSVKGS